MSSNMVNKPRSKSRSRQIFLNSPEREEHPNMLAEETKNQLSTLDLALCSPVARVPRLSSTPIRSKIDPGFGEYSPEYDYHGSPTLPFPCTQESGNEVAWDWSCGSSKRGNDVPGGEATRNKNLAGCNNTPKKVSLMAKKRSAKSYSPLLNKPPKRKLIPNVMGAGVSQMAMELRAITEKLKTDKQNKLNGIGGSAAEEPPTKEQVDDDDIFDMPTQICDESFFAEPSSDGENAPSQGREPSSIGGKSSSTTTRKSASTTDKKSLSADKKSTLTERDKLSSATREKSASLGREIFPSAATTSKSKLNEGKMIRVTNLSLDDFFDDSIDDCMIQCSQEIEEKLRLGSFETDKSNDGSAAAGKSNSDISKPDRSKSSEKNEPRKVPSREEISASQIPDDSFDDCLATVLDQEEGSLSALSADDNRSTRTREWSSDASFAGTDFGESTASRGIANRSDKYYGKTYKNPNSLRPTSEVRPVGVTETSVQSSSNFKRKTGPEAERNASQCRKFFKSKSLSDSNCVKNAAERAGYTSGKRDVYAPPIAKSASNQNLAAGSKYNVKNNATNQQTNVSYSYRRDKDTEGGSKSSFTVSGISISVQSQYTPMEIERKRLEARMKLEAKKLKQQPCPKNPNTTPVKQLVKR